MRSADRRRLPTRRLPVLGLLAACVAAGPITAAATEPSPGTAPTDTAPTDTALTIVLGGDLGLGGSEQPVHPDGAYRHGARTPWAELTAGIAPLLDGDINFANLETVVTDRNDIGTIDKAFNFRSHPAGIRHLVGIGFNVFSTANNHALDYGETGVRETLRHLSGLAPSGLKAWPGVGTSREEASRPAEITVKGARVRLSAIGIGGYGLSKADDADAGDDRDGRRQRAGMLAYRVREDFDETLGRLAAADGDLRILSVHYGAELQVRPAEADVARLRDDAVIKAGIDVVVGHHAHVAAGLQIVEAKAADQSKTGEQGKSGDRLVVYGLGNLLHPGMQDMARFDACRDYGLMVRLHYARAAAGGRPTLAAIEAITLTAMHAKATPQDAEDGAVRIAVLNALADGLDAPETGASGVRFMARPDGTGLHCRPGSEAQPGRIGRLCAGWPQLEAEARTKPETAAAARRAASCGGRAVADRRGSRTAADGAGADFDDDDEDRGGSAGASAGRKLGAPARPGRPGRSADTPQPLTPAAVFKDW